jgi:hypothetical protein
MMMIPHGVPEPISSSSGLFSAGGNAITQRWSELNHVTAVRARVSERIRLDEIVHLGKQDAVRSQRDLIKQFSSIRLTETDNPPAEAIG